MFHWTINVDEFSQQSNLIKPIDKSTNLSKFPL